MDGNLQPQAWTAVCAVNDIVPNTGVAARVAGKQVAIFRVGDDRLFAIGNYDPNSNAAVLSRGIVGSIGEKIVVASPIFKQHFDLATGECIEAPECSVQAYSVRAVNGTVELAA